MPRENGFENKRVVIVGGSSGIGLAVAETAALRGAEVVIVSSNAERVQEAVKSIGGNVRGEAVDVSDEKAVERFFTNIGAFDHLVFTAGDNLQLHELADTDLKQARRAFELRYWSALATVKYGSPRIRKGGSIVLTTGVAGRRPHSGWVIAASVCGTIEALTRALGVELAPIRVKRSVSRCRSHEPLAEHECIGAGTSIRERGQQSPCWPSRRSFRDRASLSVLDAGRIRHWADRCR